uniref:Uncharacterized protein n=1 Tax=Aegilops tauschii TaxID=37682 RepID=R7W485_AEGTA
MEPASASLVSLRASTATSRSCFSCRQQGTPKTRMLPAMASKSGAKLGTGRNKKNGNIFERWKCFDCQGFGMRKCPTCGKGGLTPEQRGER